MLFSPQFTVAVQPLLAALWLRLEFGGAELDGLLIDPLPLETGLTSTGDYLLLFLPLLLALL